MELCLVTTVHSSNETVYCKVTWLLNWLVSNFTLIIPLYYAIYCLFSRSQLVTNVHIQFNDSTPGVLPCFTAKLTVCNSWPHTHTHTHGVSRCCVLVYSRTLVPVLYTYVHARYALAALSLSKSAFASFSGYTLPVR